jgi:hypothetical protein
LRALKQALESPIEKTEVNEAFAAARAAGSAVIRQKNQLLGSAGKATLYK